MRRLEISIKCSGWFEVVGQLIFMLRGSLAALLVKAGSHGDGLFACNRLLTPLAQLTGAAVLAVLLRGPLPQLQLPSLESLTQLESLHWGWGVGLPPAISGLTRLTGLMVGRFPDQQAKAAIAQLSRLTILALQNTTLPSPLVDEASLAFLAGLPRLEGLGLEGVRLMGLPPALSQLTLLDCRHSHLDGGAAWLQHLPRLEEVWLEGCRLASLPAELTACTALRYLELTKAEGLQLTSGDVREVLARLTALTRLELGGVDVGGVSPGAWLALGQACPSLDDVGMSVEEEDGEEGGEPEDEE